MGTAVSRVTPASSSPFAIDVDRDRLAVGLPEYGPEVREDVVEPGRPRHRQPQGLVQLLQQARVLGVTVSRLDGPGQLGDLEAVLESLARLAAWPCRPSALAWPHRAPALAARRCERPAAVSAAFAEFAVEVDSVADSAV